MPPLPVDAAIDIETNVTRKFVSRKTFVVGNANAKADESRMRIMPAIDVGLAMKTFGGFRPDVASCSIIHDGGLVKSILGIIWIIRRSMFFMCNVH